MSQNIKLNEIINELKFAEDIIRANPLRAYDIARRYGAEIDDEELNLKRLYIEGKALWSMGRFEEGLNISNELKEIAMNLNDDYFCSKADNIIGNVYYDLGNKERALEYYMSGLSYARTISDKEVECLLTNNIGDIYNSYNAFDEALKYYLISLNLAKNIKDENLIGIINLNLGELYFNSDNVSYAREYVDISLEYFSNTEDYVSISYARSLLAKIYKYEKNYENSHKELKLAINIMRRLQDKFNLMQTYIFALELLLEEEIYDEAIDYGEDALDIAVELKLHNDISDITLLMANIHEKTNDYRKSLDYFKMYSDSKILYEQEKLEEQKKLVTTQINIEKTNHEKEIYRLKNVELKKKSDEIKKMYKDLNIINLIGQDITSTLDIKEVSYLLYENINKLMDATYFGIMLYDSEDETLDSDLILEYGESTEFDKININYENNVMSWCVKNNMGIFSNDYRVDYINYEGIYGSNRFKTHESQSLIFVRLIAQNELLGLITVQSLSKDAYTDYHYNMIQALSAYIGIAIKNSQKSQMLAIEIKERIKSQRELEKLNEKLSVMSYIDKLTQIPNRRSFVNYLEHELARSIRKEEKLSVLIIDIDFFKEYNDNYGHVKGDKCLFDVASILKKSIKREVDFVARYGGDEFITVLTDTGEAGAENIAIKIINNIRNAAIEHSYSKITDIITLTIGIVSKVPEADCTMAKIIHYADKALYVAKDKGKNQYIIY